VVVILYYYYLIDNNNNMRKDQYLVCYFAVSEKRQRKVFILNSYLRYIRRDSMVYVGKMVSLHPQDAEWVEQEKLNLSQFLRGAIEVAREEHSRDLPQVISRMRGAIKSLNGLIAAYAEDLSNPKLVQK